MNLVTGAAGITDIHVIMELLQRQRAVRVVCRGEADKNTTRKVFDYYGVGRLADAIDWFEADMCNRFDAIEACEGIRVVYNTAATISFRRSRRAKMWADNVGATANIVDAALQNRVEAFCHVSSVNVLGRPQDAMPTDEQTQWQPEAKHTAYALSKFRQEMEIWRGDEEGLNIVIVNPGIVIGPGPAEWECAAMSIAGRRMPFYTDGETGFVDARDLAKIMVDLVDKRHYGERYIVVGHNCQTKQIQELMARHMGNKLPHVAAKPWMLYCASAWTAIKRKSHGEKIGLTPEMARTANEKHTYTSEKLKSAIDVEFRDLEDSIANMTQFITHK